MAPALEDSLAEDLRVLFSSSPRITSMIKQGSELIEDPVWEYLRFLDD